ncbi:MAG: response regulator [Candidatus Bathyarchaeia archaeon]|jgi:DNA-binding NtrC family response regulator
MSAGEKGRILVVDDDEGICNVVQTALKNKGYIVDVAKNAKEAIAKTSMNFYNLALIDLRLPDMDGTELLTAMKETTPAIRKIIVTGYPALQNAIDAVNRGAHGYLVKPINMDDLLRTVERHLKTQRELKEYGQQQIAEFVETRVKELEAEQLDSKTTKNK